MPWEFWFQSLLPEEFKLIVCVIPFAINILKPGLSVSSEIEEPLKFVLDFDTSKFINRQICIIQ